MYLLYIQRREVATGNRAWGVDGRSNMHLPVFLRRSARLVALAAAAVPFVRCRECDAANCGGQVEALEGARKLTRDSGFLEATGKGNRSARRKNVKTKRFDQTKMGKR